MSQLHDCCVNVDAQLAMSGLIKRETFGRQESSSKRERKIKAVKQRMGMKWECGYNEAHGIIDYFHLSSICAGWIAWPNATVDGAAPLKRTRHSEWMWFPTSMACFTSTSTYTSWSDVIDVTTAFLLRVPFVAQFYTTFREDDQYLEALASTSGNYFFPR